MQTETFSPATASRAAIKNGGFMASDHSRLAEELRRECRFEEARDYLAKLLPQLGGRDLLDCALQLARVHNSAGRPAEALRVFSELLPKLGGADDRLLGWYHQNRATAHQLAGDTDAAFVDYAQAVHHLEKLGDKSELGPALSNLGLMLASVGRYAEAREYFGRARDCFGADEVRLACVDESEAQACLMEEKSDVALRLALAACKTFEERFEARLLLDALPTLQKAAADYRLARGRNPLTAAP